MEKIIVTIDSDLEELIPGFLVNRTRDLENLKAAAGSGDVESIRSIGHSLKGVGGGYGFDRITELGAALEQAAKSGQLDDINARIADLADYLLQIEVRYE